MSDRSRVLAPGEKRRNVISTLRSSPWLAPALSGALGWLPPLAVGVASVVLWHFVVVAFSVPRYLMPPPGVVAETFADNLGFLWDNTLSTAHVTLYGFALSVGIGVPLGVVLVESPILARTVYPIIVATQTFPKIAVAPLLLVWFGFGLKPKLVLVLLVAFFPIVVNTSVGLATARPESLLLARAVGLGYLGTLLKIRLPQALPSVFAGFKVAITLALVGAVVAEFLAGQTGLGRVIMVAMGLVNTPLLFSALAALILLGLVLYAMVVAVEHVALPWKPEEEKRFVVGL